MKRALIITYYWPPCGGAAVQRWLKFAKYLRNYEWEPVVYTALDGEYPMLDPELEKEVPAGVEVLRQPVWEPYSIYKQFTGRKKEENLKPEIVTETKKNPLAENLAIWIRGNFFVPDARKYWVKPSVKFLQEYLKKNPVDVIISSSSPQSVHLIALELNKQFNIPWLADFRDPWTQVDYFDQLKLTSFAESKHKRLEQEVLKKANVTTTVSWAWGKDFKGLGAKKVEVITNGYDVTDLPKERPVLDNKFTVSHVGNLSKDRNHEVLFKALKSISEKVQGFSVDFSLQLIGDVDASFKANIDKYGLMANTNFVGSVSHSEAVKLTCASQSLLLLLGATDKSQGRIPLKVYEYMAAQRPIIGVGPENSDVARIVKEAGAGEIVDFTDEAKLTSLLERYYKDYKFDNLGVDNKGVEQYSRKNLTASLAKVLDDLTLNKS